MEKTIIKLSVSLLMRLPTKDGVCDISIYVMKYSIWTRFQNLGGHISEFPGEIIIEQKQIT